MTRAFRPRFLICLLGLPVVLLAAAYLLAVQYVQSEAFAQRLSTLLTYMSGRECRIEGSINIGLMPEPHILVNNAQFLQLPDFSGNPAFLQVDTLEVFLSYSLILEGSLAIDELAAERPRLLLLYTDDGADSWSDLFERLLPDYFRPPELPEEALVQGDSWLSLSSTLTFHLKSADMLVRNLDSRSTIHLQNMDLLLQAGDNGLQNLDLRAPALTWGTAPRPGIPQDIPQDIVPANPPNPPPPLADAPPPPLACIVRDIHISAHAPEIPSPEGMALRFAAGGSFAAEEAGLAAELRFSSGMLLKREGFALESSGQVAAEGTFTRRGYPVPFSIRAPFTLRPDMSVEFIAAEIAFENDGGGFNALLTGLPQGCPELSGTARVDNFSLPRWFPFGRILPSGLQHALDKISGSLDFVLTLQGVEAPRIDALIAGIPLRGFGHVKDFSRPDIVIEGATDYGDINDIFLEILDDSVTDPVFPGPPLISEDDYGDYQDVSYNIVIRSKKAHIWHFDIADFFFRCSPSRLGTLLNFSSGNAYGGKITFDMDIIDDYDISFSAKGVQIDEPIRLMAGFQAATGSLDADGTLWGQWGSFSATMASLKGSAQGSISNGSFRFSPDSGAPEWKFRTFSAQADAQGPGLPVGGKMPDRLPWTGEWTAGMRTHGHTAWDLKLSGPLVFDTTIGLPVRTENAQISLTASLPARLTGLSSTLPLTARGVLSLDSEQDTFRLADGVWAIPGMTARGEIMGTGMNSRPRLESTFTADSISPPQLLGQLGIPAWRPADESVLASADISARVKIDGTNAVFEDFRLNWGGSLITGAVSRTEAVSPSGSPRPLWEFNLFTDSINLDRWFPAPLAPGEAAPPWELDWLKRVDARGDMRIGQMSFHDVTLKDVALPIRLINGEFVSANASAAIAGGTATATTRFTVGDGVLLNIVSDMSGVNIAEASYRAAGGTYIGGTASAHFDLAGTVRSNDDIPSAISGAWSMNIHDGFYATAANPDNPAEAAGDITHFTTAKATGILENGVAYNDDLHVDGDSTRMIGNGWINLVEKELDYFVEVTFSGVPTVPVHLTGSLGNPTSSVQAGRMFTRTLGNIGAGAFGILGGIFSLPLRALEAMSDPDMPPPDLSAPTPLDSVDNNR